MDNKNQDSNYYAIKNHRHQTTRRHVSLKLPAGLKRNYLNYLIDTTVLICGVLCAITGIVKWPGLINSLGLSYQSLPLETFTLVHDWTGIIMVALLALHLLLHLRWMAAMTGKILGLKGGKNEEA